MCSIVSQTIFFTNVKFENHIEKYLNSIEYKSIHFEKYDRTLCLIKDEVLDSFEKKHLNNLKGLRLLIDKEKLVKLRKSN